MSNEQDGSVAYKDLSDEEKHEKIEKMRQTADKLKSKSLNQASTAKKEILGYFDFDHALQEVKDATGVEETSVAGAKLVGKSLFNVGRFTVAEALPFVAKEVVPLFLEQTAKNAEKSMKNK